MLLGFIVLYISFTIAIGWWSAKFVKNSSDYVVAGRSLPLYMVTCGLFAEWFGSETVLGSTKEFLEGGILAIIEEPFGAALCLVLVGFLLVKPLYSLNLLTFSDYFKQRFNQKAEIVSALLIIPSYLGWISAQILALAIVFQVIAGLPLIYGIYLCTFIVVVYTYYGGMWAVSITDFIQTIMIIIGLLFVLFEVLTKVGGLSHLIEIQPEGFFNFTPKNPTGMDWLKYFAAWITVGLGSVPQQDVFQRILSAKDEKTAIRASFASGFMYLTIAFIPLIIGLAGRELYPNLAGEGKDLQMLIPLMVLQHGSVLIQILFFGALISAILSTTSGAILAPATILGENLIKPFLKNASDKKILLIMRLSVVVITIISAWIATLNNNIFELVGQSSSFSLVGLFIPLMAGIYWKKASPLGSMASMICGVLAWSYYEFFDHSSEIPAIIYGLIAGFFAMLLGSWIEFFIQKKKSI